MKATWYTALLPWLTFTVVVRGGVGHGLGWASAIALAVALGATILAWRDRFPAVLEVGAILTFGGLLAAALLLEGANGETVERFARPLATTGLAMSALVSALRTPFTTPYVRPRFTESYASEPAFAVLNRDLAVVSGLGACALIGSHLVGALIHTGVAATVFHWLVPISILLVTAESVTRRVNDAVDDDEARAEADLDLAFDVGPFVDLPPATIHELRPRD